MGFYIHLQTIYPPNGLEVKNGWLQFRLDCILIRTGCQWELGWGFSRPWIFAKHGVSMKKRVRGWTSACKLKTTVINC